MLSRLRGFVTRHRRKFIVTGVVIGGTFLIIKYAQRKLIEIQERQAHEFIEKQRRMQHFESTERTCNQVIIGMSTELINAIIEECSTTELLEKLRDNPSNKLELWEEMKIVAFTRLTTFIYATSMLVVTLRIQLNLLGGYLYKDITTEQKKITDETKQCYLSLIRHFLHDGGLRDLVHLIRDKVTSVFSSVPLTKSLALADMEQIFYSLQMSINSDPNDPNSKLAKYMMPTECPEYGAYPLFDKMYNETLDLLDSDDASVVCSQNICRGFSLAVDAIAERMGETIRIGRLCGGSVTTNAAKSDDGTNDDYAAGDAASAIASQNNNALLNINKVEIALAKVIPIVSGLTTKGFDAATRPQNLATSLVTFYLVSDKTKMLGTNVYESFCS